MSKLAESVKFFVHCAVAAAASMLNLSFTGAAAALGTVSAAASLL